MSVKWVTANLCFNNRRVAQLRGYPTAKAHDDAVIERWNSLVKAARGGRPADEVWVLGNFGAGLPDGYLPLMHGAKHLVPGPLDLVWPGHQNSHRWFGPYRAAGFESIQAFANHRCAGLDVTFSHFPCEGEDTREDRKVQFRLRDEGAPVLCGPVPDARRCFRSSAGTLQINVGLDVWGAPVHIREIVAILRRVAAQAPRFPGRRGERCPRCKGQDTEPAGAGLLLCRTCEQIDEPE